MMAGGEPIDWDHPFNVHIMANIMNIEALAMPAEPPQKPSTPIIKLANAETISPVAINFLMLQ